MAYVYVALRDDGLIKVGWCLDTKWRMASLRANYGGRYDLYQAWHRPQGDARLVERLAHAFLKPLHTNPVCFQSREFYRTSAKRAVKAVEAAITMADAGDLRALPPHSSYHHGWPSTANMRRVPTMDARLRAERALREKRHQSYLDAIASLRAVGQEHLILGAPT